MSSALTLLKDSCLPYTGYRDSGADIVHGLSRSSHVRVLHPVAAPDPIRDADWCFPDTEDGIMTAIEKGATHLWANTILFASHPLQTSARIGRYQDHIRVVGQGPLIVEKYDDKNLVNSLLRDVGGFTCQNHGRYAWVMTACLCRNLSLIRWLRSPRGAVVVTVSRYAMMSPSFNFT